MESQTNQSVLGHEQADFMKCMLKSNMVDIQSSRPISNAV